MSKLFLGNYISTADKLDALKKKLESLTLGGGNVAKVVIAYKSEYDVKGKRLLKITEGEYLLGCDYAKLMASLGKPLPAQNNKPSQYTNVFGNSIIKEHNNTHSTVMTVYNIQGGSKPNVVRFIDGKPVTKEDWEVVKPNHASKIGQPAPLFTVKVDNIISIE